MRPVAGSGSSTWISAGSISCGSWNVNLKYQSTGYIAWWIEPSVTSIAAIHPSLVKGTLAPPVGIGWWWLPHLLIQSCT